MSKRVIKMVNNLAGGVNTGIHPSSLADNECSELINFFVFGDGVYPRLGSTKLNNTSVDDSIAAGNYRSPSGRFKLILAGNTMQAFQPDAALSAPSTLGCRYGTAYTPTPNKRPFIFQGNDTFYMIDPAGGPLRRGTDAYYETAGIPAPTAAVTIADGGAGVMTAADYKVTVIFRNSETDDQSDFGPVSSTLTLGASKQIAVSNIPVSGTPQCDIVDIYVTPPNQTNLYLKAGSVANGITTFTINLTPLQLEEIMPLTNGTPPDVVVAGAIFDNCMFLTDGQLLYRSNYLQFETFDVENNVQPVFNNDGHDCNVLHAWGTSRLVAAKPNYIMYFTATGTGDYIPTILSDKKGVRSPHALKSVEQVLIWFDGETFQRSDNGGIPRNISGVRIKTYLDNIAPTDKDNLVAEIAPRLDSYLVKVPQRDGSTIYLAYNYKVDAWSTFSYGNTPTFLVEGYDVDEERQLYALTVDNDVVLLFDEEADDDAGEEITYTLFSKGFKAESLDTLRTFSVSFGILCSNIGVTGTLSVYENDQTTPSAVYDAYLYDPLDDWKVFECQTIGVSSGASYVRYKLVINDKLPNTFKISKLMVDLLLCPNVKRQYKGVDL